MWAQTTSRGHGAHPGTAGTMLRRDLPFAPMPRATVVTIGNFDGVHIGHAALVSRARAIAGFGGRVATLAFHPHPLSVLSPDDAPPDLTTFEQRERLLRSAGVDEVHRLEPTPALLGLSPEEFIRWVVERLNPRAFVEGVDFRFGRGRSGDVQTMTAIGRSAGFEVAVVEPVEAALTDGSIVKAGSSLVRWLVSHGRVGDAARVLGRPFEMTATVVRGERRGRMLGFPTANLDSPNLTPGDGVYAGIAALPDGSRREAAIHVGTRSTFDDQRRTVEAYILDWGGPAPGAPEYGWPISIELIAFLRDQAKFESVDALVHQIKRDIQRVPDLTGDRGAIAIAPMMQGAIT